MDTNEFNALILQELRDIKAHNLEVNQKFEIQSQQFEIQSQQFENLSNRFDVVEAELKEIKEKVSKVVVYQERIIDALPFVSGCEEYRQKAIEEAAKLGELHGEQEVKFELSDYVSVRSRCKAQPKVKQSVNFTLGGSIYETFCQPLRPSKRYSDVLANATHGAKTALSANVHAALKRILGVKDTYGAVPQHMLPIADAIAKVMIESNYIVKKY